mgnify:CR=1 FL=1
MGHERGLTRFWVADDLVWWCPLAALGVGVVLASIAYYHFEDHRHPGRIVLCFLGFFVAAVWILKIVNEVVGVLQVRLSFVLIRAR